MVRAIRMLVGVIIVGGVVSVLNGCGGGGGGTPPPPPPSPAYILLTNGRVVVEQRNGEVIIKAGDSQLPGVGFDRDVVEVKLYRSDAFVNPRTDSPSEPNLIRTFRVSRDGTLLDDLPLPEGRYTAVAENIRVVQDGKEFRSALVAYVFDVFPSEGELRTTLPVAFEARFPALGTVVEDAYVRFRTDVQAVGGEARLFLQHANGTNDLQRRLLRWPPDTEQPTHANVSFEALRGGPALGNVSRLVLKAFKP